MAGNTEAILMPRCRRSVLARVHFWGHNIGCAVMMVSLAVFLYGAKYTEKVVAAGSVVILASLVVFTINLFRKGSLEAGK